MSNAVLRLAGVTAKTGLRKTKLYELIKNGEFPQAIKLTKRAVGWLESEVDAWLESKIQERDAHYK